MVRQRLSIHGAHHDGVERRQRGDLHSRLVAVSGDLPETTHRSSRVPLGQNLAQKGKRRRQDLHTIIQGVHHGAQSHDSTHSANSHRVWL